MGTLVRLGLACVWLVSGGIKAANPNQTYLAVHAYQALGRALGTQSNFKPCVRSGAHDAQVKAQLTAAESNQALSQQTANGPSFGTPTVLVNGKVIPVLSQTGSAQFS